MGKKTAGTRFQKNGPIHALFKKKLQERRERRMSVLASEDEPQFDIDLKLKVLRAGAGIGGGPAGSPPLHEVLQAASELVQRKGAGRKVSVRRYLFPWFGGICFRGSEV